MWPHVKRCLSTSKWVYLILWWIGVQLRRRMPFVCEHFMKMPNTFTVTRPFVCSNKRYTTSKVCMRVGPCPFASLHRLTLTLNKFSFVPTENSLPHILRLAYINLITIYTFIIFSNKITHGVTVQCDCTCTDMCERRVVIHSFAAHSLHKQQMEIGVESSWGVFDIIFSAQAEWKINAIPWYFPGEQEKKKRVAEMKKPGVWYDSECIAAVVCVSNENMLRAFSNIQRPETTRTKREEKYKHTHRHRNTHIRKMYITTYVPNWTIMFMDEMHRNVWLQFHYRCINTIWSGIEMEGANGGSVQGEKYKCECARVEYVFWQIVSYSVATVATTRRLMVANEKRAAIALQRWMASMTLT